jgi:YHS domain-containing protein
MNFKTILLFSLASLAAFALAGQTTAQRQQHYHTDKQYLALEGYDPVSYFTGKPKKGTAQYTANHQGVTYRFGSAHNRDAFKANPSKYEPAYGGWCAYAMATYGDKVEVDPLTYKIANGRLLLFYNAFFNNTLEKWNALKTPEADLLKKADQSWQKHLSK